MITACREGETQGTRACVTMDTRDHPTQFCKVGHSEHIYCPGALPGGAVTVLCTAISFFVLGPLYDSIDTYLTVSPFRMLKGFGALYEGKSFLKKTAQETIISCFLGKGPRAI